MYRMCTAEHIGRGIAFVWHNAMLIEAATMSDNLVSLVLLAQRGMLA